MGFAVATGHPLTTETAEVVLRDGGTAVDACIAAACTAFVVEPVLAQPLGGGFLMVAPVNEEPVLLDGFVQTPAGRVTEGDLDLATITVDFGTALQDFHIGAGTVAAPCLMPALYAAQRRYGRLRWSDLVAPAVAHGRTGFEVVAAQARVAELVMPILAADAAVSDIFAPGGVAPLAGDRAANPGLADVLEVMASEGLRFVTEGEVAQGLLDLPGTGLTARDLAEAHPVWRRPLAVQRAGRQVRLNPPPSLGGVQIALALEALGPSASPPEVARAFFEVAALRQSEALDAEPETAARLLAPERVAALRDVLNNHRAAVRGTTHISVIDAAGMGAALTLSNGEGCGRLIPGTGIVPNNMLGEEDLVPGGPTAWVPGRRLASMMCPSVVRDPDGGLSVLGSGGSNRIRSAMTTVLLGLVDHGWNPEEAVDAPRMHVEGGGLSFEDTGGAARREALIDSWPDAVVWDAPNFYFGGVHIAQRAAEGAVSAAADARRGGMAATG
ncbi:MAG: gamma-glutamyltransferase [Pseudomonadota bacterium]